MDGGARRTAHQLTAHGARRTAHGAWMDGGTRRTAHGGWRRTAAHLILVVVLERLEDSPLVAQLADELRVVVVRLDALGVGRDERGGGLDEVGAEGALREVDHVGG